MVGAFGDTGVGQVCGICGALLTTREGGRPYALDHNHATGKIRGWLCVKCNAGLGNFEDDPTRLRAAASYVEKHQE